MAAFFVMGHCQRVENARWTPKEHEIFLSWSLELLTVSAPELDSSSAVAILTSAAVYPERARTGRVEKGTVPLTAKWGRE